MKLPVMSKAPDTIRAFLICAISLITLPSNEPENDPVNEPVPLPLCDPVNDPESEPVKLPDLAPDINKIVPSTKSTNDPE